MSAVEEKVNLPLNLAQATEAITNMLAEFESDVVKAKFNQAIIKAGGKLENIMELVVPLIYEVQGHIMSQYDGFTMNEEGFELFAKCLQHYENEESFKPLSDKFKKKMKSLTEVTQFNV